MFQSSLYEGLPFMGRSRLTSFLARWDARSPGLIEAVDEENSTEGDGLHIDDLREFLQEFLQAQEEAYHTLLHCVGQVSNHLDYWLDWTTPVVRRPLWIYQLSRRSQAAYLCMLGRAALVKTPYRAAKHFSNLHAELCRLVAFIQVSSFELLSGCEGDLDQAASVRATLEQAIQNMRTQSLGCWHITSSLNPRPEVFELPMTPSSEFAPELLKRPPATTEVLTGTPEGVSFAPEMPSHLDARLSPFAATTSPADVELPEATVESLEDMLRTGWIQLQDTRRCVQHLAETLEARMKATGRPTHLQKFAPVYVFGGLAAFSWAFVMLRDQSKRENAWGYMREVSQQFFTEWVYNPVYQFCQQLFKRLSADNLLNVQLKELKNEQEALERMLVNFKTIAKADPLVGDLLKGGKRAEMPIVDDDLAERYFERSMANPISNVMQGHLLESCMVQTQRMKVLLYASLYSVDAIILQLKWDFLMAGVMPFTCLCGIVYWSVVSLMKRRQLKWKQRMVRALAEVDRFLNTHAQAIAPHRSRSGPLHLQVAEHWRTDNLPRRADQVRVLTKWRSWTDRDHFATERAIELEKVGAALGHLDALCRLVSHVRLEATDWRAFRRDVLDLSSPELSSQQKLHVVNAMRSTYNVFHTGA